MLFGDGLLGIQGFFDQGTFGLKNFDALLRKIAFLHFMSQRTTTFLDREHPRKQFEQGGFSSTIGADQDQSLAPFGGEIQPLVYREVSVAVMDFLQSNHALPASLGLRKLKFEPACCFFWSLDALHLLQLFEFGLSLRSLGSLRAKTFDKTGQPFDFSLLIFVSGPLLFQSFFLELEIIVVIASIASELASPKLNGGVSQPVEEGSIVRDEEKGAGVLTEVLLEPQNRMQIEMIGGLIQHQQIGLHDQEAGQVGTHDPPSTEGVQRALKIRFPEA